MLQVGRIDDSAEARKDRLAHQELVDFPCCLASFSDGPHHQGLSTVTIYYWKDRFFFLMIIVILYFSGVQVPPAAKTPLMFVRNFPAGVSMLVRWSLLSCSWSVMLCSGPRNPSARRTRSHGNTFSVPATGSIRQRPSSSLLHSTRTVRIPHTTPWPSSRNSCRKKRIFFFTDAVDAAAGIGG